jgi:hypothetical protein
MNSYPVTVFGPAGSWPGEAIEAQDDADARDKAGEMAAYMTGGVYFKVFKPDGIELSEYRRG